MSRVLTLAILVGFSWSLLTAQEAESSYMGVNNCKMCHNKEEKGTQFTVWSEGRHAQAFETLKSEEASNIAKAQGLEVPPHESGECLVCHITGWGKPDGYQVFSADFIANSANARAVRNNDYRANVGCESCHGAGSGYRSRKTMEGLFYGYPETGQIDPSSVGLIEPDKDVCLTCHNEKSPTYKEFDFDTMVAKVAHPYPEEFKATRGTPLED